MCFMFVLILASSVLLYVVCFLRLGVGLLCCNVVGVWVGVIFVLSVMRVVGGVPLWVVCVFRRVDVCVCCTPSCFSECGVLCYL